MNASHLVHLMSDDLLDACGTAERGVGLHVAPFTTPERITCPACRPLIDQDHRATLERDHAAALLENEAHDAAMTRAQDLTPELLARFAEPMPRRLRAQLTGRRLLQMKCPPSRRHA